MSKTSLWGEGVVVVSEQNLIWGVEGGGGQQAKPHFGRGGGGSQ